MTTIEALYVVIIALSAIIGAGVFYYLAIRWDQKMTEREMRERGR